MIHGIYDSIRQRMDQALTSVRQNIGQTAIVLILLLALLGGFALAANTWNSMDYARQDAVYEMQRTATTPDRQVRA